MIDVHTHAFPERLMNAIYAWFRRDGWKIPYDGKQTEELFAEHRKQGIERFFVLLYAHKPGMARSLNDWLADLATVHPEVVPIGCVHQDDDVSAETEYCLGELGFAGMKLHCAVQRVSMDDPRLDPLYETLIAFNKPLIVHAGTAPRDYTGTVGVRFFARAMDRFPELRVQVAHFGLYETESFVRLAEQLPNVVFDTAAITPETLNHWPGPMGWPQAEQWVEWIERLPGRVLFGSDIPFLNGRADVKAWVEGLPLSQQVKQEILDTNARRFWNLTTPPRS
ncbi:MAG: amidohydrolase [Kyrpidia tusciae]|nr:amidohydrolase family protein [Kyrpidia tusciae]MBE3553313.1 amidohydrolase [Kyrpidia tusciae]